MPSINTGFKGVHEMEGEMQPERMHIPGVASEGSQNPTAAVEGPKGRLSWGHLKN